MCTSSYSGCSASALATSRRCTPPWPSASYTSPSSLSDSSGGNARSISGRITHEQPVEALLVGQLVTELLLGRITQRRHVDEHVVLDGVLDEQRVVRDARVAEHDGQLQHHLLEITHCGSSCG